MSSSFDDLDAPHEVTGPVATLREVTPDPLRKKTETDVSPPHAKGGPFRSLIGGLEPRAEGFNASAFIDVFQETQPDAVALATADGHGKNGEALFRTRSFQELKERTDGYAYVFANAGLKPGDRVGVFITDGIEFVTVTYALQRMGAVPVLIDPGMGVPNMRACIREQKMRGIVGVKKAQMLPLVFRKDFAHVKVKVVTDAGWFFGAKGLEKSYIGLDDDQRLKPYPFHQPKAGEPATIVYTSGSTGVPKGVVYTHAMMGGQVNGVAEVGGFTPGEAHVACFPGFALYAVACGMSVVFPEMDFTKPAKANPQYIVEAMDKFEARSAFGSPALWETFSRFVVEHDHEFPRMRAFFASGAAVQPALLERLLPATPNGNMFTPYGATESLPVAFIGGRQILDDTAKLTALGGGTCVGQVAPEMEVRILRITDDVIDIMSDDLVLPIGEIGEITVRGLVVTERYDQREEQTQKAKIKDVDGSIWHRMGDVGKLDEQGQLWFCGRKGHRVQGVIDGEQQMLHSVPCEAIFERHDDVFRAALTWLGERPNQTPVMCVELFGEQRPGLVDELRKEAAGFPQTKGIEHILVHAKFPVDRRHNAKIEREKLSEWAQQELG
ncbi:MAG: AMP-binding protein [Deltaproteobacteria bacterium]|nr:AMP-binding protein [Deltaproteobacteria bacterium]